MDLAEDRDSTRRIALAQHLLAHCDQRFDLGLRSGAFRFYLELCEQLVERPRQLAFGAVAGEVGDGLAAVDRIDGRNRLNPELRREELVGIDVDLRQLDALVGIVSRDLVEDRRELLARAAPLGPEVEDDERRHRRLDDVALEPLDRFAFGFGETQSRHGA
jgi:hypothetical protein